MFVSAYNFFRLFLCDNKLNELESFQITLKGVLTTAEVVILVLFIHYLFSSLFMRFCVVSLFCGVHVVLGVLSSLAIILPRTSEILVFLQICCSYKYL